MAADNKPKYTIIGFTVLAGVAAVIGTLVWLGGFGGRDAQLLVETYYDHPVSGLSQGSAVNFRGVKIGTVKDIILAGPRAGDMTTVDAQRVRILLAIDLRKLGLGRKPCEERCRDILETSVARGLRATVSSSGITGLSRVELNFIADPPPMSRLSWTPRYPVIPPSPSLMENFADAATKMMNQFNRMNFLSLWSNVTSVASSAARLTENTDTLIESQRAGIASIVRNIDDVAARLRELVQNLNENPSLLLRSSDPQPLPETTGGPR